MTTTTHHSFDLAEQQQAFVGLLAHPLLTQDIDPRLHRLVSRHREQLGRWSTRLGYRLVAIGPTFRLRRSVRPGLPAAVPADQRPGRRVLVLLLVIAAVLEDVRAETVTIQTISDATRDATAVAGLTPYDPVRRPDRKLLVEAVTRLTGHGVLRRRTRQDLLAGWEDSGTGPGAGYAINRDALLLLVDPTDLSRSRSALTPLDTDDLPDTRGHHLLRGLVECQGLVLADLTASERDYWRQQRARLSRQAAEMTGGIVEHRAEAALLILPTDTTHARAATVEFPMAKGEHWVSLKMLDEAARSCPPGPGGRLHWPSGLVDAAAEGVLTELADRLPKKLREAPAIRKAVQQTLVTAGLLDVDADDDWWLSPLAGRYRSATLTLAPRATALDTDPVGTADRTEEDL